MTRRDSIECLHEPFGDSFYYGPERLGERFKSDAAAMEASGFSNTTYKEVLDRIKEASSEVRSPPHSRLSRSPLPLVS